MFCVFHVFCVFCWLGVFWCFVWFVYSICFLDFLDFHVLYDFYVLYVLFILCVWYVLCVFLVLCVLYSLYDYVANGILGGEYSILWKFRGVSFIVRELLKGDATCISFGDFPKEILLSIGYFHFFMFHPHESCMDGFSWKIYFSLEWWVHGGVHIMFQHSQLNYICIPHTNNILHMISILLVVKLYIIEMHISNESCPYILLNMMYTLKQSRNTVKLQMQWYS